MLFRVISSVGGLQQSTWVPAETPGELLVPVPVELRTPELVEEGERVRYRFLSWSEGETPSLPRNRVVPLGPKIIEVQWAKEYLVRIEGPEGVSLEGTGWYEEGASLVLRAPDVLPSETTGERRKFARWESVGRPVLEMPDANKPTTSVTIDAPYTLQATYDQQYLVVARSPLRHIDPRLVHRRR